MMLQGNEHWWMIGFGCLLILWGAISIALGFHWRPRPERQSYGRDAVIEGNVIYENGAYKPLPDYSPPSRAGRG